jgi:tetratricopeptide (TPR) repeat protein
MADDDELTPSETGENTMLREAQDAVRQGDRARARDLLTRLLKADQTNAVYWVWLSTVVDSAKERLYCLQTALKLDPENAAAKRGLTILGGLAPDEAVPPFPLNRPRSWEDAIAIPREETEKRRGWANPVVRVFIILGLLAAAGGLFLGGYNLFRPGGAVPFILRTSTPRPTFTVSNTPTNTPLFRTATPTFLGPTPLSYFLAATYTATPLYVITEHPVLTSNSFESGLRFLAAGQYETARVQFEQVLQNEPDAVDAYYYIGESYRFEQKYEKARDAYQQAIEINPGFAPAFLGRARASLGLNPEADVKSDLDNAVALDPQFAEAYIERGAYLIARGSHSAALSDLETALELTPDSPLAWMYLAQAQLEAGDAEEALQSALKANQLDLTLIPVYLTLAQAYVATGQTAEAAAVLQTYTVYEPEDVSVFLTLGAAYNAVGDYQSAVNVLSRYIDENPRSAEAYFQRGLAYLNLDNPKLAEQDFKKAVGYDPVDFDAHLGLARAYFEQDKPGDAYVQAETNALPLAKTNQTKAQCYYWEAIFLEAIPDKAGADAYWRRLLQLPADAMPEEWRNTAFDELGVTPTYTATPRPSKTPTKTP